MSHADAAMDSPDYETITRALGEAMHVRPLAPGMVTVLSESGEGYVVDTDTATCECPSSKYSDTGAPCKHIRRAQIEGVLSDENGLPAFEAGEHPIKHGELL